jgi:hypothetical protein
LAVLFIFTVLILPINYLPAGASKSDYDYMMNGGTTKYVSDGSVPTQTTDGLTGEFKTEISYRLAITLWALPLLTMQAQSYRLKPFGC